MSRGGCRSVGAGRAGARVAGAVVGSLSALRGRRGPAGTLARPASVAQWKSDSVLRSRLGVRVPPGAPRSAIGISPSEDRRRRSVRRHGLPPPQNSEVCLSRRRRFESSMVPPGRSFFTGVTHGREAPPRVLGRPRPEPRRPEGRVREPPARGIQRAARVSRSHSGRPQAVAVGIRDPLPRRDAAGRPPPAVRARASRSGGEHGCALGATPQAPSAHGLLRASRGPSLRRRRHDRGWYSTEGSL